MQNNNRQFRSFIIWTVAALAVIIALLIVVKLVSDGQPGNSTNSPRSVLPAELAGVKLTDQVRGERSSGVVLIEYSDFQCPACASVAPFLDQLYTDYGGRVAFVYRHFPLPAHQNSVPAALVAEAAGQQGKFWEMADELFTKQNDWSTVADPTDKFTALARSLGLNIEKFSADWKSPALKQKITEASQEARKLNLDHTPTFFLNGREVELKSYDDLKTTIDQALTAQ